ncbi:MAG: sigma-70 family RNA polymerase sigma factor [Candidatus Schekmanbacteria bacterium]|nr:sigma-70 family RNA polymerase sigma factor [Candidatus Schekmanbacteria bacterium]
MNYQQLSDIELIELFLRQDADCVAIRDELFGRYYPRLDQRIRAVLHNCGLPYSPGVFYYNEIFLDIYKQLFELDALRVILQKYDAGKGVFSSWFLNYVVVNKVRDWLKKKRDFNKERNIDRLKTRISQEQRELSLTEPQANDGEGLALAELLQSKETLEDEERQKVVNTALNRLSSNQRAVIYLMFSAYIDLPEESLVYLAREIKIALPLVKEKLSSISLEIRQSEKYRQGERIELALACLFQQKEMLEKKLAAIEWELTNLFPDRENPLQNDITRLQLKDFIQARQDLTLVYKKGCLTESEYHYNLLLIKHQHTAKQLANTVQKWSKSVREYNAGKYIACPGYKRLAALFNIPEGTIASRINRAVNNLKELLQGEEKGYNDRICKPGVSCLGGDGHVL